MFYRSCVALSAIACLLLSCTGTGVNRGDFNLISLRQEEKLGQQFATEIAASYPLLDDELVTAYVEDIGHNLLRAGGISPDSYSFAVVNTADINAFAIPGGHVYLHRGLILAADDSDEVAGVLAHEIGHVRARHGTERLTMQYGIGILSGVILGEHPEQWQAMLTGLFSNLGMLAYSRRDEHEADDLGVALAHQAGYDPQGLERFLGKLGVLEGRRPSDLEILLRTHPSSADRVAAVDRQIATLPARAYDARPAIALDRVQDRLRSIPVDEMPQQ